MRSSLKTLFTQDANHGLSSMACSIRPEMPVNAVVTKRSEKKHNSSFRNPASLLPLMNIGRSSNRGLGLILPPVSPELVQEQGAANLSVPPDVTDRVSNSSGLSPVLCQTPETPFLDPLNLGDNISPILPLPPSVEYVASPIQRPNPRPLIAEIAPLSAEDMDQVATRDITSMVLNDDLSVQEDVKDILFSPVPDTPTVDIAEHGMSSCFLSSVGSGLYPETGVNNTTKCPTRCSPLLCDNVRLPIILSAIPIYHRRPRDDSFNPSTSPSHDGTRTKPFSSHAVVRSSVTCGHRRSHRIRQPIETSSPSMTPSPTNSPKLYCLPIHRKGGDCEAQSPKRLFLEPVASDAPTKTSSHQYSALCAQLSKRRSNVHESIRTYARCSPWNSPTFRSPLALSCSFEMLSQSMAQSDRATAHRPASIDA